MLEEDLPITVSSFLQRPSWSCFCSQYRSHRWMNMIHLPHKNSGWSEKQSCFFRRGKDESRLFWFLKAKQEKSINKKEKYTYIIHTPNAPRLRKLHLENETKTYEVLQQSSLMILQGPTNNLWALCSIHYRACILNVTIISQNRERERMHGKLCLKRIQGPVDKILGELYKDFRISFSVKFVIMHVSLSINSTLSSKKLVSNLGKTKK